MPPDYGFRRYWRALWGWNPWRIGSASVLLAAAALTDGFALLMLVPLLAMAGIAAGHGGELNWLSGTFRTMGVKPGLPAVLVLFIGLVGVRALLSGRRDIAMAQLRLGFVDDLRNRTFIALTAARWRVVMRLKASDVLQTVTGEIDRVGAATLAFTRLCLALAMTAIHLAVAIWVSPTLAVPVAVAAVLLPPVLFRAAGRARHLGRRTQHANMALAASAAEFLAGLRVAKSYGREGHHARSFTETVDQRRAERLDFIRNQALFRGGFDVAGALLLGILAWLAVRVAALPAAQTVLLVVVVGRMMPLVSQVNQTLLQFANALPAYERVMALLAQCAEAAEPDMPARRAPALDRDLRLEGVGFRYDEAGTETLAGIDLDIRARETVAVVGPSGAGKTTLADLLAGLVMPERGRVVIDGVVLDEALMRAWRGRTAYVPQDVFLFHDTIRANLAWVAEDADEAAMREALELAAADFVGRLPAGLDTVVGDRGHFLSGGERQRLALARALLRRPALLILDEATSALDGDNERRILDAIARLRGRTTLVVIAHRLSTVRGADRIAVMERGRVVEQGGWDDLANRPDGRFRGLLDRDERM